MIQLRNFIRSRLPQGVFGRNVLTLAGSVALGQGLTVLASPILTRIYSVADFGQLQAYLSVLLFVLVVVAGRYELAIVLPEDDQAAADLTVLCLGLALVTSILAGLVIWWLSWQSWMQTTFVGLKNYLWFMPVSIFGAGCYAILCQWTLRQKNYAQVGRSKVFQGVGMVATQIVLGEYFSAGFFGLLFGDAVGRVSGTWSFVRTAWARHSGLFRRTSWAGIAAVARRYRQFPQISAFSALINSAGFAVPPLLLAAWYSSKVLGWYAMTDRVMCVPTVLIGAAISQVYTVDAARLASTDLAGLRALLFRTIRGLAWLGVLPFLLIFLFGEPLFAYVFGGAWGEAGRYARLLAVMQYVSFVVWPVISTLNVLERQSWQCGWDIGRLALTLSAIGLAHLMGWPARVAVAAYGCAMLVGYVVHPMISLLAISQRMRATGAVAINNV